MANIKMAVGVRNSMLDVLTTAAGANAILKIYSGTQPAGGGAEGTILAQLVCSATLAPNAAAGVLTLSSITQDSAANNSGIATWWRLETSGGSFVLDGDVSTVAAGVGDLQLSDVSIVQNGTVALSGPNTIVAPNPA